MVDEGHEIGLHTFNHPDLSFQSKKRIDWELSQNQLAITGAAGIRTSLFRPPYSSFADAMDNKSWPVTEYIGSRGYITVVNNTDSEDWQRPGVDEIIRRATPKGGEGAIVLMHDSGGDRSQTVAALDRFLPDLKKRGYEFDNLTEALDAPSAHSPVTGADLWKAKAWIVLVQASEHVTDGLVAGLAVIGFLVIGRFVLMLVLSGIHARRVRRKDFSWGPPVTEPVSVLVPAYNEAKCIENTVRSLMAGDHPIEVLVIDDGSTDGTARIVEGLGLPGVRVIRQLNAGKPAALNRGLANARYDIVVMMDGDTVFEPATVRELVQPFGDPRVGAVAGNAKVGNRDSLIGAWQHIEYVMGFNLDRRMYDVLRCMPTIPGAVGAFRRSALERVGGMSDDTLAEDTDVTMALHRDGWRVVYAENARAWTEAPETVQQLWSQRYRWSYGTMQAIWKHRRALVEKGPRAASAAWACRSCPCSWSWHRCWPADRHLPALRDRLRPDREDDRGLAGRPGDPGRLRGLRLPAGPRTHDPSDLAAPAADPVPPAHVRRAAPVLDHRPHRRPAALAEAAPHRRRRGARRCARDAAPAHARK